MSFLCANLFSTILYVFIAIIILLLMVLIHEFGHYVVGRILGFKINEFSIGFGKAIFQKKNKRGELISLRIFPLGGYCAFDGEDDEEPDNKQPKEENKEIKIEEEKVIELDKDNEPQGLKFNDQKPWKRLLVYVAGVAFNFISAIIFSFILLISFGYDIPKVKNLDPNYANLYGELQEGDIIWKVNDKKINFAFSGTVVQLFEEAGANKEIKLTIERDNKTLDVFITLIEKEVEVNGEKVIKLFGGFETEAYVHSFWDALGRSFEVAFGFGFVILKGFWQIITGQISFSELGGPVSTIGMISTITQSGLVNFFILLPLLAANLAIFNFLPIPALDGSHALFAVLEWIFGRPVVSRKVEGYIHFYGLIALLALVIIADIVHIAVVGFPKL